MTRAERAIEIEARLHIQSRLTKIARLIDPNPYPERNDPPGVWHGPPQVLDMLRLELSELKQQIGGSERREYEKLKAVQRA